MTSLGPVLPGPPVEPRAVQYLPWTLLRPAWACPGPVQLRSGATRGPPLGCPGASLGPLPRPPGAASGLSRCLLAPHPAALWRLGPSRVGPVGESPAYAQRRRLSVKSPTMSFLVPWWPLPAWSNGPNSSTGCTPKSGRGRGRARPAADPRIPPHTSIYLHIPPYTPMYPI